tara:strand:+ start:617 stop:877 length:261 start_codon:yes stop_codon:yes gene_type:complete
MDINQLITIVKKKILQNIKIENIKIEDKTFLHKKHQSHNKEKYHLKITIISEELNSKSKIESTKIIYKILDEEINKYIHSLQILIN